jgi:ferredoxin
MTTVRVDPTRCTGIGLCEMSAPDVFEIGDDGQSQVINANPIGDHLAAAQDAVANCPTRALSIGD